MNFDIVNKLIHLLGIQSVYKNGILDTNVISV